MKTMFEIMRSAAMCGTASAFSVLLTTLYVYSGGDPQYIIHLLIGSSIVVGAVLGAVRS